MKFASAILASSISWVAMSLPANARVAPSDVVIGPLNLGMTEEEALGALPTAKLVYRSVEAPAAFELGGARMDVFYSHGPNGAAELRLTSRWPVRPGACMERLDAIVGALEPSVGPMQADEVGGYTVRRAGARSKMGWFLARNLGPEADGLVQASAFVRPGDGPIRVNAQANEERNLDVDADGRLECDLFVHVYYRPLVGAGG